LIKILADTTSTIPVDEARDLGIYYLPQIVFFGDKAYRDDYEITTAEFLDKVKNSRVFPKTAAPPPSFFARYYEEIIKNGDTALVLTPSSKISGTYRNAVVASRDFPEDKVHVVDTQLFGPGLGTLVRLSLDWVKQGDCILEITKRIVEFSKRSVIYGYVDSLEYLFKGGRIGAAATLAGSILQIKPILHFTNGQISHFESRWTKKRAFQRVIELVQKECPPTLDSYLTILHPDSNEYSMDLMESFCSSFVSKKISIYDLSPAIIAHVGPGAFAVGFFTS
jgi:DegV family protein with EDD domain